MVQPPVAAESLPETRLPDLPAPLWRIAVVGVLSLVAGVALVRMNRGGPVKSFPGQVTARIVPLTADQDGRLTEWLVEEGAPVRIGDPIATISLSSLVEERTRLEQDIARLIVDLERALAQAELDLDWRMKDVNAEIFTARLQSAELLEEKYRHEMEKVVLSDLLNSNATALWMPEGSVFDSIVLQDSENQSGRLSTILRVEAATNAADVCEAQVEMCEEQVDSLEELKSSLPERVRRSVGVEAIERQLRAAQDQLDLLSDDEPQTILASTVIGQTGVFLRQAGDYVFAGDRIVSIFDDVQRYLIVEVPSGDVNHFTEGREVALAFAGDVRRTGRVVRVAPQAITRNPGSESVVRVQIEPAGVLWPNVPIDSQVMVSVP